MHFQTKPFISIKVLLGLLGLSLASGCSIFSWDLDYNGITPDNYAARQLELGLPVPGQAPGECGQGLKSGNVLLPVEGATITSEVNMLRVLGGRVRPHYGTDFAAPTGTNIVAVAAGRIVTQETSPSYGNYIVIDHGQGGETRYAHMQRFASGMRPGSCVAAGQLIGHVGSTGRSTGPHLHIELRLPVPVKRPVNVDRV